MTFIADLHIHSHFSRATSQDLIPEDLSLWAQKKGISVIGTGDFTHPGWLKELREKLVEAENGLYRLRPDLEKLIEGRVPASCKAPVRFILSGEISCIYKRGDRTRKIHNLILLPDFESVEKFQNRLHRIGNITSDGRPIFGLDSRDLLEIALEVSDRCFFIPAHIWTPWFSLFGSKSGFDSVEECFGELSTHIYALETGLSSDPPMNRTLSALDNYVLVSNSDAHSAAKLGREANLFDVPLNYDLMLEAIIGKKGFSGTIEFFPEEGKYHYDGHRKCQISLHPSETKRHRGICPACGKPLTVGVLSRVYELSDRDEPNLSKNFFSLIPLTEILSEILDCGPSAKRVVSFYEDLLVALGPELEILMRTPLSAIEKAGGPLLLEAIDRMRQNKVIRQEGYDGEYGVIRLFDEAEKARISGQAALFAFSEKPNPSSRESVFEKSVATGSTKRTSVPPKQSSHSILDPLNEAQRKAVLYQGGHLLIVAGPGTGKTMTLTHRMAYQIQTGMTAPDQVLGLTFTNKAAREMRKRVSSLLSERVAERIRIFTFHALCLEVLRTHGERAGLPSNFTLCSESDASIVAEKVLAEAGAGKRISQSFLRKLPHLKRSGVLEGYDDSAHGEILSFFAMYQAKLRQQGMLDLDDLEVETLRLFHSHSEVVKEYGRRFPSIFVDEYQDTNPIQAAILKMLVHGPSSCGLSHAACASVINPFVAPVFPCALGPSPFAAFICAIGDPDQAIYGFRGTDVRNFLAFEKDFPGAARINLSRNYRSTQSILDCAAALLNKDNSLRSSVDNGGPIRLAPCRTDREEAEMIVEQIEKLIGGTTYFSLDSGRVSSHEEAGNLSFGDIAVLFRLNSQGDALEEALSRAGIPCVRSGERPLTQRYPVDILWRYLQTINHPNNPYFSEACRHLLRHYNIAQNASIASVAPKPHSHLMKEQGGGGRTMTDLIDHSVLSFGLTNLQEDEKKVLESLREIATMFGSDLHSFLDSLSLERGIDHGSLLGDRVALMSLHAAKGLEWPVVFVTGCEDQLLPCTLFGERDEEEEKRLLYVGMTRARSRLILSFASRRTLNGRVLETKPSPFLSLIPKKLCSPLDRGSWKPKKTHKQLELF